MTIAALFVEPGGCYFGLPDVEPWDATRDARRYAGPHPVVAHPPCARWGRYWHGSPSRPHQYRLGDDDGCFAAALAAVRKWGGVLEHPAYSRAWREFGIVWSPDTGEWVSAGIGDGGWVCHVEQAHYGHLARKPTWLYAIGVELPPVIRGRAPQRLPAYAVERYGRAKASRIGMMAVIGSGKKPGLRAATPLPFRDLLLSMAASAGAGR